MNEKYSTMLSVVIPTHGRPHHLPRAIESALLSVEDGKVEVIVVPNGPDTAWKKVQDKYDHDSRVRWAPISVAHANVARNHGLSLATGRFIRFLDDDDALNPVGAIQQLNVADIENAEICSGTVAIIDKSSAFVRRMKHADKSDLFSAMARPERICLPLSHLFLRDALADMRWDESTPVEQDTAWMIGLASEREWRWKAIDDVVGEWTWHDGDRTSRSITQAQRADITISLLLKGLEALCKRNAINDDRKCAIAEGLWQSAHTQFHFSPFKFSRAINVARDLSPGCRPPDALFALPAIRHIHPLFIEWLLVPKRWWNHFFRAR